MQVGLHGRAGARFATAVLLRTCWPSDALCRARAVDNNGARGLSDSSKVSRDKNRARFGTNDFCRRSSGGSTRMLRRSPTSIKNDISPDGRPPHATTRKAIVRLSARALTRAAEHTAHDQSNVKSVRHAHTTPPHRGPQTRPGVGARARTGRTAPTCELRPYT